MKHIKTFEQYNQIDEAWLGDVADAAKRLVAKAKPEDISAKTAELDGLIKKYNLNVDKEAYLKRAAQDNYKGKFVVQKDSKGKLMLAYDDVAKSISANPNALGTGKH